MSHWLCPFTWLDYVTTSPISVSCDGISQENVSGCVIVSIQRHSLWHIGTHRTRRTNYVLRLLWGMVITLLREIIAHPMKRCYQLEHYLNTPVWKNWAFILWKCPYVISMLTFQALSVSNKCHQVRQHVPVNIIGEAVNWQSEQHLQQPTRSHSAAIGTVLQVTATECQHDSVLHICSTVVNVESRGPLVSSSDWIEYCISTCI